MPIDPHPATPHDGRRDPGHQHPVQDDRRNPYCQYWTVPEIAVNMGLSERSVWAKFMKPKIGRQLLRYYDFGGEIRIDKSDYEDFKRRCLNDRTSPEPVSDRRP